MALLVVVAGLGMLCALLWACAIYALPVFAGVSAGWWALEHGAGLGCIPVGLAVGAAIFLLGRMAAASHNFWLRGAALALFALPAACVAFNAVGDLAVPLAPLWRYLFEIVGAVCAAGAASAHLKGTTT